MLRFLTKQHRNGSGRAQLWAWAYGLGPMGSGLWARAYGLVPALQATGMRRRDVSNAAEPNGTSSLEKKTENYAGQRELKKNWLSKKWQRCQASRRQSFVYIEQALVVWVAFPTIKASTHLYRVAQPLIIDEGL